MADPIFDDPLWAELYDPLESWHELVAEEEDLVTFRSLRSADLALDDIRDAPRWSRPGVGCYRPRLTGNLLVSYTSERGTGFPSPG